MLAAMEGDSWPIPAVPAQDVAGAQLRPLKLIPGCNTAPDVTRAHVRINIQRDLPWLDTQPIKDKPLVIVAGGPSLQDQWPHILSHDGDVLALNNAYGFLLERGIDPDYFMLLDARKENIDFLRQKSDKTHHFIAAQCHPSVFDALADYRTTLYLTTLPGVLEICEGIDKPKVRLAGTVGTVGIKALCWAYAYGYRELHLYGYDSSYADGAHHAFPQPLNDAAATIDVHLEGKRYVTTPTFAHQATEFCALATDMIRAHHFDINLHCSGLLPDLVEYSNRCGEIPLELREAAKYREMWTHPEYRKTAPGSGHVYKAILDMGMQAPATLIDFGCGTGEAAHRFKELGYVSYGIDFADNCRNESAQFHFCVACLWDLPEMRADFGFCTDVMEHIPTEKVNDVLRGIADRTQACYFNVSTVDDNLGGLIGKKLHMTVMPATEWEKLMRVYWRDVQCFPAETDAVFVCKQPITNQ